MEELHEDIERYLSLEQADLNIDFWTVRILYLGCALHSHHIGFVEYDGGL